MKLKEENLAEINTNFNDESTLKTSIKLDEIDKLFDILIGGYHNPRASFIRETVSNAWDAMKEANNPNPVIVKLDDDDGGNYIEIIDEGIGMDYEFITKRYTQILDSTKDQSNEQIGGYGIGRMSPLSYQNNFIVTSVKNGLLNQFNVYRKTSGMPDVTLLIENEETNLTNGTTVKIYLKEEDYKINNYSEVKEINYIASIAAKELSFFDNVIFEFKNNYCYYDDYKLDKLEQSYNSGKIVESNLFKLRTTNQYSKEIHLVLGKVCYPIDWKTIGVEKINIPIGIKFNIGDIQVTMTRESIRYSDETILLIKNKIADVVKNLIKRYNEQNLPVEGLINYVKKINFSKGKNKYLIFPISDNFNYSLDVTCLYNLTSILFKPITHFKVINPAKIENILYSFTVLSKKIVNSKEVKNIDLNLIDYDSVTTKIVLLEETDNIPESKEFKKYINNCIFVKRKKISKYYYNAWLESVGVEFNEIEINKTVPVKKRDEEGNLIVSYKKVKTTVFNKPVGIIKELLEYRNIIFEELKKDFEVIEYKDFKIPEEWLAKQKAIAKANRQPKLKLDGIIPYKNILSSYVGDLHLNTLKNFKGILIYGFLKDNTKLEFISKLLQLNKSFKSYNKKNNFYSESVLNEQAIKIIRISQSNEYLFNKMPNAAHVNLFMQSNNKIVCRLIQTIQIRKKYQSLFSNSTALNILKKINFNIYLAVKELESYTDKVDWRIDENKEFAKELLSLTKSGIIKYEDKSICDVFEWVNNYFDGCEILQHLNWDEDSLPYIIDYLKSKGKKLNYIHYNNSNIPQQKQKELSNVFINSFGFIDPEDVIKNPFKYLNKQFMTKEQEEANRKAYEQQKQANAFLTSEESTPESDDITYEEDLEENQELELQQFNTSEGEE